VTHNKTHNKPLNSTHMNQTYMSIIRVTRVSWHIWIGPKCLTHMTNSYVWWDSHIYIYVNERVSWHIRGEYIIIDVNTSYVSWDGRSLLTHVFHSFLCNEWVAWHIVMSESLTRNEFSWRIWCIQNWHIRYIQNSWHIRCIQNESLLQNIVSFVGLFCKRDL